MRISHVRLAVEEDRMSGVLVTWTQKRPKPLGWEPTGARIDENISERPPLIGRRTRHKFDNQLRRARGAPHTANGGSQRKTGAQKKEFDHIF